MTVEADVSLRSVNGAIAQRLPIRAAFHEPSATGASHRVLTFLAGRLGDHVRVWAQLCRARCGTGDRWEAGWRCE